MILRSTPCQQFPRFALTIWGKWPKIRGSQKRLESQKMKIHEGDTVQVIRGKDKGVSGKVIAVDHDTNFITVEGVNRVFKHVRPSQKNPQGGRLHKEMPIQACSVMLLCPKTNKTTRVGFRFLKDGSKERFARCSGESLATVSPPIAAYAK